MTLTLYSNPMSRGRIARWMMEEAGQPYETVYLDFATTMKAQPHIGLNPMGKVPTLVHDGRVVTEYAAICAYMADAFPQAGLAPADRSAYYRWLFFGAGPLEAAVIVHALGVTVPPERRGMVGFRDIDATADVLADWLSRNEYLAGDSFSACDVATGSNIGWGLQFRTIPARPALIDYWDRIRDRPAAIRAREADDAALAAQTAAKERSHG
jgi:glutathione S-transferase